jgi:hypothetical protein
VRVDRVRVDRVRVDRVRVDRVRVDRVRVDVVCFAEGGAGVGVMMEGGESGLVEECVLLDQGGCDGGGRADGG